MAVLMSGNQAFALGAWEAGVAVCSGYPGTPSTEILENVEKYKADLYCEWAPNEKVGFEVAAGACLTGARALTTMKHVGLNVAADPLMTLAFMGTNGGFVAIVADDPGMHSSQNEQDTRHYARFGKIPVLEPSDSQEAKDFLKYGFELSEKFRTPVIVRSTTRVSHSLSLVEPGKRITPPKAKFEGNPQRYIPLPANARPMRVNAEKRYHELVAEACQSPLNRIELADNKLGIIACGVAYQYVKEIWPDASVLKLGWAYPFPDDLIQEFAALVETLLVVEELDPIVEEHVRQMGIDCHGRDFVPGIGELSPSVLAGSRARMEGREWSPAAPPAEAKDLPVRPPVLCPACPHRGVFYALTQMDVIVNGDIGCYSLGALKPLAKVDTTLCMGGGVTLAHGMDKAGEKRPIVGMVGDSTFFHSGVTGLLNIAYNKGKSTIIVVDNHTTAMTGHQDHPGTGMTLMGTKTGKASIEAICRACGINRVVRINPYDLDNALKVLKAEIEADEPSVVISEAACVLLDKAPVSELRTIDEDACISCGKCLALGCPAIESRTGTPVINQLTCMGCSMCEQLCPTQAIAPVKK